MTSYKKALYLAARFAYQSEVVDTDMEEITIGENGDYATPKEWVQDRVDYWLEQAELMRTV